MNPSRRYQLSSGAYLLDSVHKEIIAQPSADSLHYEVLIYEGEFLPGSGSGGVRVTRRHPDAVSAHLQADEEYARSLAIGWLVNDPGRGLVLTPLSLKARFLRLRIQHDESLVRASDLLDPVAPA